MSNSFYSREELKDLGLKSFGENVLISRFARFYDVSNISVGDNVRIDDFCILSGKISIGSYCHISAYCALYGKYGISIGNYSGISPRCTIFSASDDFSGDFLIGPMIDDELTNVTGGQVILKDFCQLGSNCVVLPDLVIETGVSVGAMSLVRDDLKEWSIYHGIPAKFFKNRSKKLLDLI